jgi:thiol-disulfide isomerase/thioredoxin
MQTKKCSKCGIEKTVEEFYKKKGSSDGLRSWCKDCDKEYNKSDKYKEYKKKYNKTSEKYKKYQKEYNKEYQKKYKKNYIINKLKTDPIFKLKQNIRTLIRTSLKSRGYSKHSRSQKILGASFDYVTNYLFTNAKLKYPNFTPEDFLNSNKYHIDHIIPLSLTTDEEAIIRLNHHTNLRIILAEENLTKSDNTLNSLPEIVCF